MRGPFRKIFVLTGAGVSAESGINTFRGRDGLWEGHRIEDVATPEAFARQPALVHRFYNERRRQLRSGAVAPNPAHVALAEFEARCGAEFLLVTQNVDDLHERAGSRRLRHMHGELLKARCARTGDVLPWTEDLDLDTPHPSRPALRGTLRPHIVWFGEMPLYMDEIEAYLADADLFVAIGTSAVVYPAAGFVRWTPPDCRRVEINPAETPASPYFGAQIRGPASVEVPRFFSALAPE